MRELHYDVVIVGCGVGGLYTALNLPEDKQILMLSKAELETCDSMLAQGGICVLRDEDDYDSYFEDTMRAGHYENRKESVDIMIRGSRDVINDLIGYGVEFERNADGSLAYTKEGAHSKPRICFHEDITGEEITTRLLSAVKQLNNVTIFEHTTMTDIIEDINHACVGILAKCADGEELEIYAENTVFATGGIGGQYKHSTNYPILTGDGCEIARKHGVELEHMDYVQIHPTCFYTENPGRSFLISESARGEGAIILNHKKERFVDELQPRDVVTKAIQAEMEKEGKKVLFVGTKKQAQDCMKEAAEKSGMYYVNQRWLGGMLTNFETIQKRVQRLNELETMEQDGTFDVLPKKEVILLKKEMEKLQKNLGGIKEMKEIPGVLFVVDPKKERIAILEARKLNIPVVGLIDTNCNPEDVDYAIPGNDDAIRAVKLIADVMANAIVEGRQGESMDVQTEEVAEEMVAEAEEPTSMEEVVEATEE